MLVKLRRWQWHIMELHTRAQTPQGDSSTMIRVWAAVTVEKSSPVPRYSKCGRRTSCPRDGLQMHPLWPAAPSPDAQASSRGPADPQGQSEGSRSSWDGSHLHSQGSRVPQHAHHEAPHEEDPGGPMSKAGRSTPSNLPWRGAEGAPGPLLRPLPPAKAARLPLQAPPLPRGAPFQAPRCPSKPHTPVLMAPDPRPPARPKALKERKADSLGCPLKPPLHFHQPLLQLARRLHSRNHFLLPSPHTCPTGQQAPPRPAVIGRACLKNKVSGSQLSSGSETAGAGRKEPQGQTERYILHV